MTHSDLEIIERRLVVHLPAFYREFVMNYPNLPAADKDIATHEVLDDPHRVIAENEMVRSGRIHGLEWPDDLFVVGVSGCGDFYAIKLNNSSDAVWCWNHEVGGFEESASSLSAFVRKLLDE